MYICEQGLNRVKVEKSCGITIRRGWVLLISTWSGIFVLRSLCLGRLLLFLTRALLSFYDGLGRWLL